MIDRLIDFNGMSTSKESYTLYIYIYIFCGIEFVWWGWGDLRIFSKFCILKWMPFLIEFEA